MEHILGPYMRPAARLLVVGWLVVTASVGLAAVEPHPDWVNSLKPGGEPGPELTLAREGETDYVILLPTEPTGPDKKAAEELAKWLGQMTGAAFPIVNEGGPEVAGPVISIGKTARLAAADLPQKQADLGAEGIAIGAKGKDLLLWGGRLRGAINTVYVLLEEDLGCRWYSSENLATIPNRPTLTFRPVPRVHIPPLELRDPFYGAALQQDWSVQNRTNSRGLEIPAEWGGHPKTVPSMVHTSEAYVSSAEYFKTNPEYFAMNAEGERKPTQLCLTNPDVLRISIERAMGFIEEHTDARFLDFSANDRMDYCHCPTCAKLDLAEATDHGYGRRYGSHAGTTIAFVNALADAVAAKHPHILVTCLAYLGTLEPTRQLRPRDNVRIVMTTTAHWGTVCRYVTESPIQADIMRGWHKVGAKLIIWHYPNGYGPAFVAPMLNLHVISGDMRFFTNNGAKGIMLQALDTFTRGIDRELLRSWLAAKQMWNPRLNTTQLVRDFTYGFYGRAAEPMQRFQDLLYRSWDDLHMEPALQYGSLAETIYEAPLIEKSMALLNEAEQLAGDDVDLRTRVRLAKYPIWYCQARRGPVDGLDAYNFVLDEIAVFATNEYGLPVMDWSSASSCAADLNSWRAIAKFDPKDSEFVCPGPQWEFLPDPAGQGEAQRWFESAAAPAMWQTLHDDQIEGVNPQGLNELKGDVWFRTRCTVPEGFDSRTYYWLLLDAFDREDTWVYLDGKAVFRQVAGEEYRPLPVLSGIMQWPVMVAARGLLEPGTTHDLVIRVHYRDRADGRRWRPVSLVSSNLPPLTHGGGFPDAYPGKVREIPRLWPAAINEQRRLRIASP